MNGVVALLLFCKAIACSFFILFSMESKHLSRLTTILFLFLCVAGVGVLSWCSSLHVCYVGRYEAEITVTNLTTKKTVNASEVRAFSNGDFILSPSSIEEPYSGKTDSRGRTEFTFINAYNSPLSVVVEPRENETIARFSINPKDIEPNQTITVVTNERYISGGSLGDPIELHLDIGDWSW